MYTISKSTRWSVNVPYDNDRREETMERYFIESPHTVQECLNALDGILAKGAGVLAKYEWGCMAGDHTGYAIVEARSESEAKETIPAFLGGKARIVKLNKFTPEQIREFHRKAA
jgi:hypothetical protein